ncbi:MAG: hypothetical protein MH204_01920 [Fimbriimonadaceae bacterium]|nr:hypothetical protein [Fimbriimonadaceae bacterium]
MADPGDVAATKAVRREINKRMIDSTQGDIRVTHGVCYLRGVFKPVRGGPPNVKGELETVTRHLVATRVLRDVSIDVIVRT